MAIISEFTPIDIPYRTVNIGSMLRSSQWNGNFDSIAVYLNSLISILADNFSELDSAVSGLKTHLPNYQQDKDTLYMS